MPTQNSAEYPHRTIYSEVRRKFPKLLKLVSRKSIIPIQLERFLVVPAKPSKWDLEKQFKKDLIIPRSPNNSVAILGVVGQGYILITFIIKFQP